MKNNNFKVVERRSLGSIFRILFTFLFNDTLNSLILWAKKNRRYHFDRKKYEGINLGSSTHCPPRWIGISGGITIFFINLPAIFLRIAFSFSGRSKKVTFKSFREKIKNSRVIHYNLFYSIPFKDNCIPYVFSSHFFEHLTYSSAQFVLAEAYRVMEPGGVLRINVPSLGGDVQRIKDAIVDFDKGDIRLIQEFLTEPYEALVDSFSHHRYMYNVPALILLVESVGFTQVKEMPRGEGLMPDLDLLESRKSIIVEAVKPT